MKQKPLRATPQRWTFKVVTNSGNFRLETTGPIDPTRGECLRILQSTIFRLSGSEIEALFALTARIRHRVESERSEQKVSP